MKIYVYRQGASFTVARHDYDAMKVVLTRLATDRGLVIEVNGKRHLLGGTRLTFTLTGDPTQIVIFMLALERTLRHSS